MDERLYCGKVVMDSGEAWEYALSNDASWSLATPVLCVLEDERVRDKSDRNSSALAVLYREVSDGTVDPIGTVAVSLIRETAVQGYDEDSNEFRAVAVRIGRDRFDAVRLKRVCEVAMWKPSDRVTLFVRDDPAQEQPCFVVGPRGIGMVMSMRRRDNETVVAFEMVPA